MQQLVEFSTNHVFLVSALVALIVLVVVNEVRIKSGGASVNPADAIRLINNGALVLDVRGAPQFEKGHVVSARNMPLTELDKSIDSIERYKDKPILVYCDSGGSGGQAAAKLRKNAFAKVSNLQGGLTAWRRENLPLETGRKPTKQKKKRGKHENSQTEQA